MFFKQTSVGVGQIKDKMSQSSMRENKNTAEKRERFLFICINYMQQKKGVYF